MPFDGATSSSRQTRSHPTRRHGRGPSATTSTTRSTGVAYVVMGLTTRTWDDERVPIAEDEYRHRKAPRDSAIVPHAVASLSPALMTDYVCRIDDEPLDRAVDILTVYLE